MRLYEDGKLIGPGAFPHVRIMLEGFPAWSCTGNGLLVNSSDNSDPAKNGRKYVLKYTAAKDWKWEDKPSFNEKLEKIRPYPAAAEKEKWWCASLKNESPDEVLIHPAPAEVKKEAQAALKRHIFTENGKALKSWYRRQNLVVFKTSDNSDPRKNKREYRLRYTNKRDSLKKGR